MTAKREREKERRKLSISEWNAITRSLIDLSVKCEKLEARGLSGRLSTSEAPRGITAKSCCKA